MISLIPKSIVRFNTSRFHQMSLINSNFKQIGYKIKYSYAESEPLKSNSQKYIQRAYTPSYMSKLLIQQLPTTSYQRILHQITLYSQRLLPFDYDYFCQSIKRLIPYQQKLSLQELLMLFELSIEYKIDHIIMQTHFQNQLYCRVYLSIKKELSDYDRKMDQQLNMTYKMLQSKSGDHFNVIDQKFKHLLQDQQDTNNQNQNQKQQSSQSKITKLSISHLQSERLISKPIYHAQQRKNKAKNITSKTLKRIINVFLSLNSKNIEFNKLLLEINTIRLDQTTFPQNSTNQLNSQFLLTYTRLAINLLQLYMSQYHVALQQSTNTQPARYTHRSIKQVYKLQAFYYYQVAKLVQDKKLLQSATNQQLGEFIKLISGFPIKRRSFRKSIGQTLIQQTKRRGIDSQNLMKFFELSRYDNKLLQHFEQKINGVKSLPTPSQITQQQTHSQQIKKPLTPQVIQQSNEPKQNKQNIFKMPAELFKKITKRKSKPKNKKNLNKNQQQVQIDLTQPDQAQSSNIKSQTSQQKIQQSQTINQPQNVKQSQKVNQSIKN